MAETLFPLRTKEDAEPIPDWTSLCRNPETFMNEVAARLLAVGNFSPDSIIISPTVPSNTNRLKIWIKTSFPYGIGYVIEGSYKMDYGMSGMPVDIPFIRKKTLMSPMPGNTRRITDAEATTMGLPKLQGEDATREVSYYIFEPAEIEY